MSRFSGSATGWWSVRHQVPRVRLLVEVGEAAPAAPLAGACGYEELIASSEPAPRVSRSEQDVFLSYTGGTTGLPKGVRYTIGRGVRNSLRLRELFLDEGTELGIVDYAAERARNGNRLVAIPASPLMHSTGFTFASLPTLTSGGQVATLEQLAAPGDLGRIEADGSVTLIGRGTSVINTGGEKVYPAEVEEAINELDGVEECLVTGIPDERFGQLVAAIVVAAADRHLDASDVIAAARRSLAGYKVPRLVVFAGDVPRAPNGKTDYAAAQALLARGRVE